MKLTCRFSLEMWTENIDPRCLLIKLFWSFVEQLTCQFLKNRHINCWAMLDTVRIFQIVIAHDSSDLPWAIHKLNPILKVITRWFTKLPILKINHKYSYNEIKMKWSTSGIEARLYLLKTYSVTGFIEWSIHHTSFHIIWFVVNDFIFRMA